VRDLLVADETGARWPVDRLLVTGGAARLPVFRDRLVPDVRALLADDPGKTPPPIDWTDRGKEAVAQGAALAAYYHDYASVTAAADASSRLVFLLEEFRRSLPFSVFYLSGGGLKRLVELGQRFPEKDGRVVPARAPLPWQRWIPFHRRAGGGPLPPGESDARLFTQYLGQVNLPDQPPGTEPPEAVLLPDHSLQVIAGGKVYPVETEDQHRDPLDSPFRGAM
jgi:hypothetical protein